MDVVFLIYDGVKQLDIVGPAEVFAQATSLGADYRLRYVSPSGNPVRTSIGATLMVDGPASEVEQAHLLILPGGDRLVTTAIEPELLAATRRLSSRAAWTASVCTGAFLLAATGSLSGRRATTHWQHARLLARAYPDIKVSPDALFVSDGRIFTSAGVSSGIDLALALVEADKGADLARQVAQQLVVYMRRPGGQSQFSAMLDISPDAKSTLRHVVEAVAADPSAPYTLDSLARIAGVSPRHLTRLFASELGITPAKFVEEHRLEVAKSLLLRGESVNNTAARSGFQNAENLRRVFVTRLGVPPSAYRARFEATSLTDEDADRPKIDVSRPSRSTATAST